MSTSERPDLRRHHAAIALTDRARRVATFAASRQAMQDEQRRKDERQHRDHHSSVGYVPIALDPRFMISGDVCQALAITDQTLHRMRRSGEIKGTRGRGGAFVYEIDEVERVARILDEST